MCPVVHSICHINEYTAQDLELNLTFEAFDTEMERSHILKAGVDFDLNIINIWNARRHKSN